MAILPIQQTRVEPMSKRRSLRREMDKLRTVLVVADSLMIAAASALAWELQRTLAVLDAGLHGGELPGTVGPGIGVVWVLLLAVQGAYSSHLLGGGTLEFRVVSMASVVTAGAVGMLSFLLRLDISRDFVLLTFALGIPMLLVERYAVRKVLHWLRRKGRIMHRVVAVGGASAIGELHEVLERERYAGYEICGACLPGGTSMGGTDLVVPHMGRVEDTRRVCEELGADTVLVARGGYASSEDLRRIAWDLEGSDIDLVVVPSLTDVAGPRIHMRPVAGLPLIHVEGPQADQAGGILKRLFDLVGALVCIAIASPLFIAVLILVKAEDGGSVLFRQTRVGRDGRRFEMLKFRSMVADAEARRAEIAHLNDSDGLLFKIREDPRVTRIGRFLRRFSIDELPQLFNVLRGEMSIVGPRPPLPAEVEAYEAHVHRRLLVRPGMTGLWQVSGRSTLTWSESVRLDLYYVDNWSMVSDMVIIAKTVKAVVSRQGAY